MDKATEKAGLAVGEDGVHDDQVVLGGGGAAVGVLLVLCRQNSQPSAYLEHRFR